MVFRRRSKRSFTRKVAEFFYPRGGWRRATSYIVHRLRRLPDTPQRIGRGIACGIFASFTPLFGLHFVIAALCAWAIRGNVLAALLATFFGNPLTFPFIVSISVELGNWMLGQPGGMHFPQVMAAFGRATGELTHNLAALFSGEPAHWDRLGVFFWRVFLPYMIGGIIPGVISGFIGYLVTLPLIHAYRNRRRKKLRARFEKSRGTAPGNGPGQQ